MTTEQIILYVFIALIIYYVGKKFYLIKSIKQYSPSDAWAKVKKERNVVFLDVRTEKERKQSSIKGSHHIPVTDIKDREQELKKFKLFATARQEAEV
jgi:ribosomal protein L39E